MNSPAPANGAGVELIDVNGDDARLAPFRDLKDARLRLAEQRGAAAVFVAEGETVVRHLIASPFDVTAVVVTPHHRDKLRGALDLLGRRSRARVPVYVCPAPDLEKLSGFNFHRGVLAAAKVPSPLPLEDVLSSARVVVVCDRVINMDNVGSVFRNLACFVDCSEAAVLLTRDSCHPLYRKALRVSVGHALRVPFGVLNNWPTHWGAKPSGRRRSHDGQAGRAPVSPHPDDAKALADEGEMDELAAADPAVGQYGADPSLYAASDLYFRGLAAGSLHPNIDPDAFAAASSPIAPPTESDDDLEAIKRAGFLTIAMTPHPSAVDIRDLSADLRRTPRKIAIILGAEGPGLQKPTLERADVKVRIPMSEGSDSLNVATSLAVALSWLAMK
ncbi:hypothetical protein DFJ74DRAFT_239271 [Hyaloraphidium curvatum]|nr:hypothetical protein DFJ74DRAFT_239271 [Hyaloraphidium curvatum]